MVIVASHKHIVAPSAPLSVNVDFTDTRSVRVSWQGISDISLDHYAVYRSSDNDTYYFLARTKQTFFEDKNLPLGSYFYKIKSIDEFEYSSAFSPVASIVLGPTIPYQATKKILSTTYTVFSIASLLKRKAHAGTIKNLGNTKIFVQASDDGTSFGQTFYVTPNETHRVTDLRMYLGVHSVRAIAPTSNATATLEAI